MKYVRKMLRKTQIWSKVPSTSRIPIISRFLIKIPDQRSQGQKNVKSCRHTNS